MNVNEVKKEFKIFSNYPELIYLDNAATTQKPKSVIKSITDFYEKSNANIHRGLYPLSEKATTLFEESRIKIAKFINADPEEIIFVSGATEAINGVVISLIESEVIPQNPNVAVTVLDHHSSILPLQKINPKNISYLSVNKDFEFDYEFIKKNQINVDILALPMASNVTGTVIDIAKLKLSLKSKVTLVDATQSIAHLPIDVKKLEIDILTFSGHKAYGPTGIGILYVKKSLLEKLHPWKVGGGMVYKVDKLSSKFKNAPDKFEAGTPNIAGAVGLAASIDFMEKIGIDNIQKHETDLKKYLLSKLKEISGIKIIHPTHSENSIGVVSFLVNKVHPHDVSQFLGQKNICVRAGHHCVQIFHTDELSTTGSTRVSLSVYNSIEDIDRLTSAIKECIAFFK